MSTINERLQQARKKAGYENATEAAEAFGWNVNTYRSHENGARGLRFEAVSRYARAFNASLSWILTGTGEDFETNFIRLSGHVQDKCHVEDLENEKVKTDIVISFPVPRHAIALLVKTQSLYPRYMPGDIIICWNSVLAQRTIDDGDELIEGLIAFPDDVEVIGSMRPKHPETVELIGRPPIRDATIERFIPVQVVVRFGCWTLAAFVEKGHSDA